MTPLDGATDGPTIATWLAIGLTIEYKGKNTATFVFWGTLNPSYQTPMHIRECRDGEWADYYFRLKDTP